MSYIDRAITSWFVPYAALLSFWEVSEAGQAGQQYASPYLPCAWMATMVAPSVFMAWQITRRLRSRQT